MSAQEPEEFTLFVASNLAHITIRKGDSEVKLTAREALKLFFRLAEVVEELVRALLGVPTRYYGVSLEKLKAGSS